MEKLYEEYRPLLFSLAYQMLGSVMDAEDIVHDTFLSLDNKKGEEIQHIKAYLCRMVTNRCLDYLKSARKKRELYIGPWLPEPLLTEAMEEPLQKYLQKDRISIAFLLLLEKLSPPERCIVVLRDSFSYTFDEISAIVDKTTANCRQIYRRAKAKIHSEGAGNFSDELEESMLRKKGENQVDSSLLEQLVLAILQGEPEKLSQLLAEDVVAYSDGGGKVKAALQPIYGADRVSRFLLGISSKRTPDITFRPTTINGSPGLVFYVKESLWSMVAIEMKRERIQAIYLLMNPDKLSLLSLSEQQAKLT
ncbi:RNA polymerase sigma-70 factor [Caldalkalibacillus mannanilyticus]|uniref:RNA polymerase sigma-70 factor n=1 Tax=Caldalkalibacillus mannanilyticus TaxID=1418 RepID=UPI00055320A5|nr:RNA polymerase sigma-70 factor [Caldalkalibacillus mannanilyticus]